LEKVHKQIVLIGGTTMYLGFGTRLKRKLGNSNEEQMLYVLKLHHVQKNMVFLGGVVYANFVTNTPTQ
jgi:actin-related protein